MWKWLLALPILATATFAQENPSAYEALRVVGTQLGRASMNHVVAVTGVDGNPQPGSWKILLVDRRTAGGFREVVVANGGLVSDGPPHVSVTGASENAAIKTAQLNLDSSGAYAVASHTAETSHVIFALVNYTLRADHRGNPTWVVTLLDAARAPVGTIHIAASRGSVTRVEGMYTGRIITQVETNPTDVATSDDEVVDEDENIVKKDIKRMFQRTKKEAVRMFRRVRRSFDDFMSRR